MNVYNYLSIELQELHDSMKTETNNTEIISNT